MSKPDCLKNMLDLSTAHMPKSEPDFGIARVIDHGYGFIVFVNPDYLEHDTWVPDWLLPIMKLAVKHDCILINFDMDADRTPLLPVFDW